MGKMVKDVGEEFGGEAGDRGCGMGHFGVDAGIETEEGSLAGGRMSMDGLIEFFLSVRGN